MSAGQIASVFRFEWTRAATVARWAWWGAIVAFPVGVVSLLLYNNIPLDQYEDRGWGAVLFALVPDVVCLLGLLLWATPVIQSELEAGSWTYLVSRPGAKTSVLLGKYLAATTWTALAALAGLATSLLLVRPTGGWHLLLVLAALVVLSCVAYGALYCLIGVLFHRRAMVAAVAYTLVIELLVGFVPAVVNQFTIQFRLRCLLIKWMRWDEALAERRDDLRLFFDLAPAWQHTSILLGFTLAALGAATYLLHRREYATADEA
jgi:ABC-type transport system involved in multi-copper enzyme maturation permease subunit